MKHLDLYEAFNPHADKYPLSNETRKEYLKELGQKVTYPDIYQHDRWLWDLMVNTPDAIEYTSDSPALAHLSLPKLNSMAKEVRDKIWGEPQAALNSFVSWVHGELDEGQFGWRPGLNPEYYVQMCGVDMHLAKIMKALADGHESVEWVRIK